MLLANALVLNEYDRSSGYRRTTVRRLAAAGAVVRGPITVFGTGIRGVDAAPQPDGSLLLAGVGSGAVHARRLDADGTAGPHVPPLFVCVRVTSPPAMIMVSAPL